MTYEELRDAIDGLSAYDGGASGSGICDEMLRGQVITQLDAMTGPEVDALLQRMVDNLFLTPDAQSHGCGQGDADDLREWIMNQGVTISHQGQ